MFKKQTQIIDRFDGFEEIWKRPTSRQLTQKCLNLATNDQSKIHTVQHTYGELRLIDNYETLQDYSACHKLERKKIRI